MLILKCTQKAATELGVKPRDLSQLAPESNTTLLGDWFVNTFRIGHSKFFLFANAETLYSFLVEYKKRDLVDISEFFRFNLEFYLFDEGFSNEQIDRLLAEYTDVTLAKTDSRSVLGSMNDIASMYQYFRENLLSGDVVEVVKKINRTPQLKRGGRYSIDLLKEKLNS